MFRKCLKYELRAYSRWLVPTFIAFMVGSVLLSVAMGALTSMYAKPANGLIAGVAGILLSGIVMVIELAMYVIPIMVFVLTILRFYKSFFTDEGYLTFTLPVSVDCHLSSKLVGAAIADIFGVFTTALSIIIIASGAAIANKEVFKELFAGLLNSEFGKDIAMLGLDTALTIVLVIVVALLSVLGNYLLLYLSISLGSMIAKKHRFIVCGACYLGVSAVVSAVSSVIGVIILFLVAAAITNLEQLGLIINIILAVVSALLAVEVAVCYFITRNILKNKVNLD